EIMMEDRLMFVYRGVVTNDNSEVLLLLLEKEMERSEFGFVGRKRLFMFVLESLQNVSRHSNGPLGETMSLVVYSKKDNGYTVTTANVISRDDEPELREQLMLLNTLEAKEIRKLYREKLSTTSFSSKGGAGLGLIEMAKKTGNRLDYDFIEIDDSTLYFVLSKSVDSGGTGSNEEGRTVNFSGKNIFSLEKMMAKNNIGMVWSGHLSSDIEKQVLSFTETKMSEDDIEVKARRKVFSIMVESLQNISKYNPGFEIEEKLGMPIAMIVSEKNGMRLTTGNLIKNSMVASMEDKLKTVNRYDKNGLKELYRISLSEEDLKAEHTGIMGLIDIARKSGHKLEYQFDDVNDEYSYYVLSVLVDITGKGTR
ncbi:MAG: SiaB family protein kinase, partial [Bacteroidales bacterium]|nr:SiaB family protein kinase [Bacteroidales bacterium]